MKDKIDLMDIGLKGLVTVELFDAESGELQNRVQKENFIGIGAKRAFAKAQYDLIAQKIPIGKNLQSIHMREVVVSDFFNRIILTTDGTKESPLDELVPKGNIVGAADIRGITTQTSPFAGVLNVNESYIDNEKIHIVADFGTDRGNGVFQSVGFINSNDALDDSYYGYIKGVFYQKPIATYGSLSNTGMRPIRAIEVGGEVLVNIPSTNGVYKLDGRGLLEIKFSTDGNVLGIFPSEGNIYLVQAGTSRRSSIYKIDVNGSVLKIVSTQIPNLNGVIKVGEFFYVSSDSNVLNSIGVPFNTCIYKLDSEGNLIEILPLNLPVIPDTLSVSGYLPNGIFILSNYGGSSFAPAGGYPAAILYNFDDDWYSLIYQRFPGSYSTNYTFLGTAEGKEYFLYGRSEGVGRFLIGEAYINFLCSRVLLPSPQTKTNTQTMKLTYDLYYTDWTKI